MSEGQGHGEKLSRKRSEVIAALLSCATIKEAAAKVGVSERTVRRWLQKPDFARDYRKARLQLVDHARARLQEATGAAVESLRELLDCGHLPTRCRAAIAVLDHVQRGLELEELAAEIEELKRRLTESGK